MTVYLSRTSSPLGELTLASDGRALTGLWLDGQKYFASTLHAGALEQPLPLFGQVERWLGAYFAGHNPKIDFPLSPEGSAFRQAVWLQLLAIPHGTTITYGEIANRLAAQQGAGAIVSARAVGGAVGHNPISIIIPCHRVVGANGSLTGYAGGIDRKIKLLQLENIPLQAFKIPKTEKA